MVYLEYIIAFVSLSELSNSINQSIPVKMVDTQNTNLQEELTLLMTMVLESEECSNEVNSGCTDATNASYEEIEEEASLKHVDFDVSKNINYLSI